MRKIKNENPGTDRVLVGHGLPTGPAAIDETTIYLIKAKEVFRRAKDKILRDPAGARLHKPCGSFHTGGDRKINEAASSCV